KTIRPLIVELKPNQCVVKMNKARRVENHMRTVHAIAMCNIAELAAGLMTDVSIPVHMRWIPVEMNVKYLKKAKTHLTAVADGEGIDWTSQGDVKVPVKVTD